MGNELAQPDVPLHLPFRRDVAHAEADVVGNVAESKRKRIELPDARLHRPGYQGTGFGLRGLEGD